MPRGRKPHLEKKTIEEICRLAAFNIIKAFRAPENIFPFEKKVALAEKFVLKKIPNVIEGDGANLQILNVYIPSNDQELEKILAPVNNTPVIEEKKQIEAA